MNIQRIEQSLTHLSKIPLTQEKEKTHKKVLNFSEQGVDIRINSLSYKIKQWLKTLLPFNRTSKFESLYKWTFNVSLAVKNRPDLLAQLDKNIVDLAIEKLTFFQQKSQLQDEEKELLGLIIGNLSSIQTDLGKIDPSHMPSFTEINSNNIPVPGLLKKAVKKIVKCKRLRRQSSQLKLAIKKIKGALQPFQRINDPTVKQNIISFLSDEALNEKKQIFLSNGKELEVNNQFWVDLPRSAKITCNHRLLYLNLQENPDNLLIDGISTTEIQIIEKLIENLGLKIVDRLSSWMHQSFSSDWVVNTFLKLQDISINAEEKNPYLENLSFINSTGNEYSIVMLPNNKISLEVSLKGQVKSEEKVLGYIVHSRTVIIDKSDLLKPLDVITQEGLGSLTVYERMTSLHKTPQEAQRAFESLEYQI